VNATPGLRPDNTRSCRSSGPGLQQRTWHERLAGHPYTLLNYGLGGITLLGKLTSDQSGKKLRVFMEPNGALPCRQNTVNGLYPEPDESSLQIHILIL
jgi:hypothetical protein